MKRDWKLIGIIITSVLAVMLVVTWGFNSIPNKAYRMETGIEEIVSTVSIQEKRRNDLIINLVDTVKSANEYEQDTLVKIAEARADAQNGNVEEAAKAINIVIEAYPELKSQDNYKHLMNELSLSENAIANYRETVNKQVREYKTYVRSFPARSLLKAFGYDVIDYEYLVFEGNETLTGIWD